MFDVQFRTMDEVGLKGFDAMRMLSLDIFDVMAIQLGYVSGDEPFVLGLDLPGVAPDLTTQLRLLGEVHAPEKALEAGVGAEVVEPPGRSRAQAAAPHLLQERPTS